MYVEKIINLIDISSLTLQNLYVKEDRMNTRVSRPLFLLVIVYMQVEFRIASIRVDKKKKEYVISFKKSGDNLQMKEATTPATTKGNYCYRVMASPNNIC